MKSQFTLPSGGGGGGGAVTEMTVERLTDSPVIVTPTDNVTIQITYSSVDGDGEQYDGTYSWKIGSTTVMSGSLIQGLNTFDLTEHCSVGTQKLILTVTDSAGSTVVKSWTVQIVDVRLESAFSDRYTNALGRAVNFTYTPYGSVPKTVHFKLDGVELESVTTSASGTLQSYTLSPQTHGAHLLECWITATVNSTPIETEHIFKDIIWYDESSSLPVIGCAYRYDHYGQVSARQYDTTRIAYVVYDPSTSTPAVTLAVDGVTVNQLTLTEALNTWAYKADDVAVHVLTITCRGTSVEIRVNVHELGYDVSPVTANLEFDFDPIGRSNTAANRLWHDENHPEVEMTVSNNFDWQNGGYKIDNDGNLYVTAGLEGTVEFSTFLGLNTHYLVRLKSGERVEIIQESKIEDILDRISRDASQVIVHYFYIDAVSRTLREDIHHRIPELTALDDEVLDVYELLRFLQVLAHIGEHILAERIILGSAVLIYGETSGIVDEFESLTDPYIVILDLSEFIPGTDLLAFDQRFRRRIEFLF